jgi:hypothetical protein
MLKKIAKPFFIILASAIIFVILVVIFVDSDEEGKIRISFPSSERRISDNGFNALIEREISLASLSDIDWAGKYNEALGSKYATEDLNSGENQPSSPTKDNKGNAKSAKEIFADYLKKSDAELDGEKNPLKLALEYRDTNKNNKIDDLAKELDGKIVRIERIVPEEEVLGYHLVKLRMLRDFKGAVETIKLSQKGTSLEESIGEKQVEHLSELSLIMQKYLIYFFFNTD